MQVAMWYNNRDIRLEDLPTPEPGSDEMLVKVISCGICGSDISEWYRLPRAPLVLGHEIGGEIIKTGQNVKRYKAGDRVFVAPKVPCMACRYCENGHYPVCPNVKDRLPGGLAQFIVVPSALVDKGTYLLPDNVFYDHATFIEPLACVTRAQRLCKVKENQTVMVFGCGMSGLLHVKLAKTLNCRTIAVDINEKRLDFAQKCGADVAIHASESVSEFSGKADVVMICTSAMPAIEQAWQCVEKGGSIVFFAVPEPEKIVTIPINDFWMKEVTVLTSYYCGPPDIKDALAFIAEEKIIVDDMITHHLPLKDVKEGFRLVTEGTDSIKIIIHPNA